jgi:hypothetical protein
MVGGNDVDGVVFTADETRIATWARTGNEVRLWDSLTGQLLADPVKTVERLYLDAGPLAFVASGRFLTASGNQFYVWPMPPAAGRQSAPEWLLRLATAAAGGEIDARAAFHEQMFEPKAYDEIRRKLTALPVDAPFAEWGRWFLADRATRPMGPGLKITVAEAERIEAEGLVRETAVKELQALMQSDNELKRAGKFAEAAAVERQMLALVEERFGKESGEVSRLLPLLSQTLMQASQAAEAEPVARAYLALCEKLFDAEGLEIPTARGLVGWSLLAQQRPAEAEPLLLAAYEGMKRFEARVGLSADQRTAVVQSAEQLARLYETMQQPAKAAEWRQQATRAPTRPTPTSNP